MKPGHRTQRTHLADLIGLDVELLRRGRDAQEVGLVVERRAADVGVVQQAVLQQRLRVGVLALPSAGSDDGRGIAASCYLARSTLPARHRYGGLEAPLRWV